MPANKSASTQGQATNGSTSTFPPASPPRQRRRSKLAAATDPDAGTLQQQQQQQVVPAPRRSSRLAGSTAEGLASQASRPTSPGPARAQTPSRPRTTAASTPPPPPAAGSAGPAQQPSPLLGHPGMAADAAHAPELGTQPGMQRLSLPSVLPGAVAGLPLVPRRQRRGWAVQGRSAFKIAWEHTRLGYDEIPEWMRDNCLIRTRYRPQMAVQYALLSLFTLHNETVNTWSHIAGAIIMILRMIAFYQLPAPPPPLLLHSATHPHPPKWPLYLFLAINCYVYCVSSAAHLLHVISKRVNDLLWRLDHAAIALSCTVAFVPICIYVFECSRWLAAFYCCVTCILAAAVMAVSSLEFFHLPKYRAIRAIVQLSFPLWAQVPLLHMTQHVRQHPAAFQSLLGVYEAIGIMVLGAGIFACRVTEWLFPGKVDLLGSSHQIMHVTVVISHLVFMQGGQGLWLWRGSVEGMCPGPVS